MERHAFSAFFYAVRWAWFVGFVLSRKRRRHADPTSIHNRSTSAQSTRQRVRVDHGAASRLVTLEQHEELRGHVVSQFHVDNWCVSALFQPPRLVLRVHRRWRRLLCAHSRQARQSGFRRHACHYTQAKDVLDTTRLKKYLSYFYIDLFIINTFKFQFFYA